MGIILASMMCIDLELTKQLMLLRLVYLQPIPNGSHYGRWYGSCNRYGNCLARNKFSTGEKDAGKAASAYALFQKVQSHLQQKTQYSNLYFRWRSNWSTGCFIELVTPHGGVFVLLIPNAMLGYI